MKEEETMKSFIGKEKECKYMGDKYELRDDGDRNRVMKKVYEREVVGEEVYFFFFQAEDGIRDC